MEDIDRVLKSLEALQKSMSVHQCYTCSYEFIDLANNFGTEIVADAIEIIKEYRRYLQNENGSLEEQKTKKHGHIVYEECLYRDLNSGEEPPCIANCRDEGCKYCLMLYEDGYSRFGNEEAT